MARSRRAHAPEGNDKARVLVIRDRWKNVGMGFMPEHVASIVRFAVQACSPRSSTPTRRSAALLAIAVCWRLPRHLTLCVAPFSFAKTSVYVYFENYGRYDWTKYFYGYLGLDMRWTESRSAAWERKFASVGGAVVRDVEVWHDEERVGDEEWEQTVRCTHRSPVCHFVVSAYATHGRSAPFGSRSFSEHGGAHA